ncbi:MAG: hypothetical protein AABY22_02505 [Nanoarchaeota archaeon]
MTEETAYKLGKLDFPCFYSQVLWKMNREPFELANFFEWNMGMGWPCKKSDKGEYITDWENIYLHGSLKINEFKEIKHKLAYIRGRLNSYSVNIQNNTIKITYANSYNLRDFLTKCLEDVIMDKFVLLPEENGVRKFSDKIPKYTITKSEIIGTIPGTPSVELIADKEIIDYIIEK